MVETSVRGICYTAAPSQHDAILLCVLLVSCYLILGGPIELYGNISLLLLTKALPK